MSRFERFMEAWGLLTLDWMRSDSRLTRWAGLFIGAVACWLMVLLMFTWAVTQATRGYYRRITRR